MTKIHNVFAIHPKNHSNEDGRLLEEKISEVAKKIAISILGAANLGIVLLTQDFAKGMVFFDVYSTHVTMILVSQIAITAWMLSQQPSFLKQWLQGRREDD